MFASHKSLDNLIKLFIEELDEVAKWLNINKLSLNVTKTHFIVFHNKQKVINIVINIKINNSSIDPVGNRTKTPQTKTPRTETPRTAPPQTEHPWTEPPGFSHDRTPLLKLFVRDTPA